MNQLKDIKKRIESVLDGGDILFIVPPFPTNYSSMIGPHILAAIAGENGYKAEVLYLNILFASIIGMDTAQELGSPVSFQYWGMIPERLFVRSAYGLPPLGITPELINNQSISISGKDNNYIIDYEEAKESFELQTLVTYEELCYSLVQETTRVLSSLPHKIIGCSIRMGQTNCGIALLNGIKHLREEIITIIGGTNCQEEMAEGIASLSESIDYIFSGESERSFAGFLKNYRMGKLPQTRIIEGIPLTDMDSIPYMNCTSYFMQLKTFLEETIHISTAVAYETSRGCWWAKKKKCTFCGLSDKYLAYRHKSKDKVTEELDILGKQYPGSGIVMTDLIMPPLFMNDLVTVFKGIKNTPGVLCYLTKANLKLNELIHFKKANVRMIATGIEALSNNLLQLMNKGQTAAQNILLLRNAFCTDVEVFWLLLWGVPGDKTEYYEETLTLLPLIRHLQPPHKCIRIHLERFSEYHKKSRDYGIQNLRPWEVYSMIYPRWADINKLAYYFAGEYVNAMQNSPDIIQQITKEVITWKKMWKKTKCIMAQISDRFIIYDNRFLGNEKKHIIDGTQAGAVMRFGEYKGTEYQQWAIREKLGIIINSSYVPLVTTSPELLLKFE